MKYADLREFLATFPPAQAGGRNVFIYGLTEPDSATVRYIGKSEKPLARLRAHWREKSRCHRSNWIQSLRARGLLPEMVIIENIADGRPWQEAERRLIAFGRANGWPLTNNTSGGDGVRDLPPETRAKMAANWRGRKHSPETIQRLRTVRGQRPPASAETRAKMSAAHRGRVIAWRGKLKEAVCKLTVSQAAAIRERLNLGELVQNLAREFGVHRTTVSKIKKGIYLGRGRRRPLMRFVCRRIPGGHTLSCGASC